jgi:hypothetical protein
MESALEKFHHLLAHFGNTGMNMELADGLLLRRTTEDNTRVQHSLCQPDPSVPAYLSHIPQFWDHSFLSSINRSLVSKRLKPVFENVREPTKNNGEVFLSKYLAQQLQRNEKYLDRFDVALIKYNYPLCEPFCFPLVSNAVDSAFTAADGTVIPPKKEKNGHKRPSKTTTTFIEPLR